jgi:hypothetical protein
VANALASRRNHYVFVFKSHVESPKKFVAVFLIVSVRSTLGGKLTWREQTQSMMTNVMVAKN